MSAKTERPEPAEHISLDDIRHRAEVVKDLAATEAKEAVGRIVSDDATKTLMIVVGVVVVAASIGYMLGARGRHRGFVE